MRVFITGATGFIGKYLALGLANQGHEVHALARPAASTKALEAAGIRIFPGDLLDTGSVLEAMRDCQHVYHLAGFARAWHRDRKTFHRVNVTGTRHVLDAASSLGVLKAVMASTAGVLPPCQNDVPVNETSPRRKGLYTTYEHSKQESEDLARKFASRGLPVVIVNPTKVFGPGPVDQSNSATFMIREYLKGKWRVIPGNGKGIMDYVYVEDVSAGIRLAMEKGRAGEQYILGGEPVSYDRFFEMTASYATSPNKLYRVRVPLIMGIARLEAAKAGLFGMRPLITPEWVRKIPFNWSKDSTKANKELGYTARPFEEALQLTINWLRKTGQV